MELRDVHRAVARWMPGTKNPKGLEANGAGREVGASSTVRTIPLPWQACQRPRRNDEQLNTGQGRANVK
jgi:hypothetical protein